MAKGLSKEWNFVCLKRSLFFDYGRNKAMKNRVAVAEAMMAFGGSFVSALGATLLHADPENTWRIYNTWPEYWQKYLEMSKDIVID